MTENEVVPGFFGDSTLKTDVDPYSNSRIETLRTISTILLIFGILGSILIFYNFGIKWFTNGLGNQKFEEFNLSGIISSIEILLLSLIIWASAQVIATIAMNLIEIRKSLKKD